MKTLSIASNQIQKEKTLSEVCKDFERWRMTRSQVGPIPEELWSAAVDLCRSHPPSKVSLALRLNYTDLRKRVERIMPEVLPVKRRSKTRKYSSKSPTPPFVDISPMAKFSSSESLPECSMEIRDRDGFSMKMHCRGEAGVDVLELCRIVMDSR